MVKKKKVVITPKQITHLALILVTFAGSLFAWFQTFKEAGFMCGVPVACTAQKLVGLPICMWGAIAFTIALILVAALWFME